MPNTVSLTALLVAAISPTIASAQPDKAAYDLQERCGKRAEQVWQKDFGQNVTNSDYGTTMANYENHYNSKLNKCFIFEESTLYKKGGGVPFKTLVVVDINENKVYASFD